MPANLKIDHKANINGSVAPYDIHLLICTGKDDWKSRIDEENGGSNLAAEIKELRGKNGVFHDPYHSVSVTNSSFSPSIGVNNGLSPDITSAYIFPSFKYLPIIFKGPDAARSLVMDHLLPTKLHPMHNNLDPEHRSRLLRKEANTSYNSEAQNVQDIMVLICGHGGRDMRCGIMGPVLRDEFENQIPRQGLELLKEPIKTKETEELKTSPVSPNPEEVPGMNKILEDGFHAKSIPGIRVGLISHVGGHKFAGNVILYVPPTAKTSSGEEHPFAGCGVWYGRVEPKHVEGIVKETILGGRIILDMFRGGIRQNGEMLTL